MAMTAFVVRYGGVYEHSPWVAEKAWQNGLKPEHDTVAGLGRVLQDIVDGAGAEAQLALIRSHPDLAGKASPRGELTAASASEQSGAGLDQCGADEFALFLHYNKRYRKKFEFPFIMAVKGSNRAAILDAFGKRLQHTYEAEFVRALLEIHKIAALRLQAIAEMI